MRRGRPLRFLGGVLACWAGARIAILWPSAVPIQVADASPAMAKASAKPQGAMVAADRGKVRPIEQSLRPTGLIVHDDAAPGAGALTQTVTAQLAQVEPSPAAPPPQPLGAIPPRLQPLPPSLPIAARGRWAGDAWLIARPDGGDSLAFGQLGASQGGARVTYALDPDRRVALSGRVSAPLHGRGSEAGIGVDLQPTRLPVHLLAEARAPLDGGSVRPAAELFGGITAALPDRLRLDAYAQGGAVWKRGGFADGAALVIKPLVERGGVRLEAGGGAWGAAQRHAARLDVGPTLALAIPTGGASLRLGVDYRIRAVGHARPGSGPALTLGGSF